MIEGLPHDVTQRGNPKPNVFIDDTDRRVYLRLLGQPCEMTPLDGGVIWP